MNKLAKAIILCTVVIPWLCAVAAASATYLRQFSFDEDNALRSWRQRIVEGKVDYFLDREGDNGFIHAFSKESASALYYRIGFKLKEYPFLSWRWRVLKFPKKESLKEDDYAIRVYVIFLGLSFSSSRFIEYIWAEHLPQGTIQQSPSAKNIMQIVVRSGKPISDEWFEEERNVAEDYRKVFKTKHYRTASAIAILCNSNLTKSEAEALVDHIIIGKTAIMKKKEE